MRKLAWAIIFILLGLLIWAGLCLWQGWIAKASSDGLAWAGGGLWIGAVGIGNWIRTTASATNTAFLFYSLIVLIVALPLWAGLRKLWAGRPKLFGRAKTAASSAASSVASTVRSSTPVGATIRPTTTTATVTSNPNISATVEVPEEEVTET